MIQFHCTRSAREVILRVSTSALDRAVAATDPVAYAGVNLDKVALLAAAEARLRAPQVDVFEGCLGFINGRHQARAALWQGRKVIPILVDRDDAAEVREILSRFRRRLAVIEAEEAKERAVQINVTDIHGALGAHVRAPIIEGMSYGVAGMCALHRERAAATFGRGRFVTAKIFGRDGDLVGTLSLPVSDDDVVVMKATVWSECR